MAGVAAGIGLSTGSSHDIIVAWDPSLVLEGRRLINYDGAIVHAPGLPPAYLITEL